MPDNNYYIEHHGVIDVQTGGKRTEEDKYDEGYTRNMVVDRVVALLREAIADSPFAEIVISTSGNRGYVIKFGQLDDETMPTLDED